MIFQGYEFKPITEIFVYEMIMDLVTTATGFLTIEGMADLNPMVNFGWPLMISLKFFVTVLIMIFMEYALEKYKKNWRKFTAYIYPVLMSLVLIWNGINLFYCTLYG